LSVPAARPIKKAFALAVLQIPGLRSKAQDFVRCALLNTGQWALNGRTRVPTLDEFSERRRDTVKEMLGDLTLLKRAYAANPLGRRPSSLLGAAEDLPKAWKFQTGTLADLVVASPPYPGIHMLYHRWQVDGRRETPAPYWLTNCQDGKGASYYGEPSGSD
jgi:hypothetical protein